jgi:kynurenine formamidase
MFPGHHVIDLSLPLGEDLPCSWPNNIPYQHKLFNWFTNGSDSSGPLLSRGPFQTRWLMLAEHTGTHFDAPTHWIPPPDSGLPNAGPAGAITSERVPLEQLIGPAVVVDMTQCDTSNAAAGESPSIDASDIEAFETQHGSIVPGEIVLLRTDWDRHYVAGAEGNRYVSDCVTGRATAWPAPTAAAIELLVDRGVRCIGTDTPSVGAAHDGFSAHVAGLAHGLTYVEGLGGLSKLPVRGSIFMFLPLNLRGGTGAPGRAIALLADGVA